MTPIDPRLENKLDAIQDRLSRIDVTLARQEENIAHHIRRTDLLEKRVEQVANWRYMALGVAWFIGFVTMVTSIILKVFG